MRTPHRLTAAVAALALSGTALTGTALATPPAVAAPAAGAIGLGDKVWPELGNGGYDVVDQRLALTFNDKLTHYTARTTLVARTTQSLDRFDLDLLGPEVTEVRVNGLRARWRTTAQGELVITPARPIRRAARFVVQVDVRNKVADETSPVVFPPGLVRVQGFVEAINQPSGARRILAVSDHPAQKAPATISITAPAQQNSIANGRLVSTIRTGKTTTRVFREDRKLATELLQIGVGPFTVLHRKGPHSMDLRYAVQTSKLAAIEPQLKSFDESVRFMEQRLGRFPGARAGAYINPGGGELETQGLTLMSSDAMTKEGFENNGTDGVVLHEVSHEWFGNSVSPKRWADLWLNEGHAVFYENQWVEAKHLSTLTASMRDAYQNLGNKLLVNGPIAAPDPATWPGEQASLRPYSSAAYQGGALTLYALQEKVGPQTFKAIERAWVERYNNSTASTADFIALASRVAHQDLKGFLSSWLYGTHLPAMPNHPDWKPGTA